MLANIGEQAIHISIHAPARGATTSKKWGDPKDKKISIHAPARGATNFSGICKYEPQFQFTPLREGRRGCGDKIRQKAYFNSRPCERGDGPLAGCGPPGLHFNSRPCERGDDAQNPRKAAPLLFQFTPLREGRPATASPATGCPLFQFTPLREGRRLLPFSSYFMLFIFQFTPLREGRLPAKSGATRKIKKFQFTPLREGRQDKISSLTAENQFQFTPLREGRREQSERRPHQRISIHAPARGATCTTHYSTAMSFYFNSRPCERGDARAACTGCPGRISIHAPARGATCSASCLSTI